MAKYKTNSLGFPLVFNGPDTVEDFDLKAGFKGAALQGGIDDELYRGTLPEWQAELAKELEKLFGVPRGVDETQTEKNRARSKSPDKVNPVPEKVKAYLGRVRATLSEDQKKGLPALAQSIADRIEIDPSPSKRTAAPKRDVLEKADSILAQGDDVIQSKVEKFLAKVPGFQLETDENDKPERTSFARLIAHYLEAMVTEI